ncbi:Gfo/Idh/MocA family protein [Paenibacillus phyllosphaerae]|nr:Gfo/Idh/MocA family oxidoreductase [Paenibacillus phyllosphaerae]
MPLSKLGGIGRIRGVASRNVEKAVDYTLRYGIDIAYPSYEALLADEEIDLVYIALSNELHAQWALKAIRAGKHVLVEKPLCLTAAECAAVRQAMREHPRVLVFEALMVEHHPWQAALAAIIDSGSYGKLKSVHTQIHIVPKNNYTGNYRSERLRGGGSFYDLGCYWLQFLQAIGCGLTVEAMNAQSDFAGPDGCDWTFRAQLGFGSGVNATVTTSFELPYKSDHVLELEHARIHVRDFFRANVGEFPISLRIEDDVTGEKQRVPFPPQHYYTSQLHSILQVLNEERPYPPIEAVYERIQLAEQLYQLAVNKRKGEMNCQS